MDSTKSGADAPLDTFVADPVTILTPQRRARYHDRNRWMLKPLKQAVFRETKIRSSGILKRCLRRLGVKLDLRLTSAWKAVMFELLDKIKGIKAMVDPTVKTESESRFKPGDRVVWNGYKPTESSICQWFPLQVIKIENGMAHLDMLYRPVPVEEVEFAA